MTINVEIKCINKSDRLNVHERIQNIGGVNPDGSRWKMTQVKAIQDIKDKKYAFFVTKNSTRADVIIAKSRYGFEYIKTAADGEEPNNLLSLPECPA